jgi:hypothetical protein
MLIFRKQCPGAFIFFMALMMQFPQALLSQKINIRLGKPKIYQNEFFTISVSVQGAVIQDLDNFPAISGFSKAGTSTSSIMKSMNGRVENEHTIIQNYLPRQQGKFVLPAFSMEVNGRRIQSGGTTIEVIPGNNPGQSANPFAYNPFEDNEFDGKTEIKDVKADAFFSVLANKKEVWAGEGLTLTMSFIVSDENQATLNFYDTGNQLSALQKKIKPENSWEENFGIDEVQERRILIDGKKYTEYRIYQAVQYPQSPGIWEIPALKFDMMQVIADAFRPTRQEIKAFYSKPLRILVKDLPPHPMKGKVSVGDFRLLEKAASVKGLIQQGIPFSFGIEGEGNISYIQPPTEMKTNLMDIYPPNAEQEIQRAEGKVSGKKTFSYLLVPRELGKIETRKSLFWVFFNTQKSRYDTLIPKTVFLINKNGKSGNGTSAQSEDSFFALLDNTDESELSLAERKSRSLFWYNLAIAVMAFVSVFILFWKK